jgi:hypothetical protein
MGLNDSVKTEMKIRWSKKQWEKEGLKRKSCAKKIFESIKGCKYPLIASGATTIGSADRAPDKIIARIKKSGKTRRQYI